eukprot:CAMPEP_0119069980 /NCGR_PEP_ID=MMETSP1178-20130426/33332_1 /TAXON_ID=33656 /ORGANISM="unid sp, Strain CCMP2000" /LENGTH=54 /DNA_ID=CAMNT_0007051787 /DNA_START=297 /DNA_END=461 /DNA_ORIENTATION=-
MSDDALKNFAHALPRLGRRLEDVRLVLRGKRFHLLLADGASGNPLLHQIGLGAH